jgi:hypothetical protein
LPKKDRNNGPLLVIAGPGAGKHLKQLFDLHEKAGTLGISKRDL